MWGLFIHILQRYLRSEHDVIVVEDVFEMCVSDRVGEESLTESCVKEINEESIDGNSCNACIVEFWGLNADVAEQVVNAIRRFSM